jgi:anthranilate phosphoribosyltransferase
MSEFPALLRRLIRGESLSADEAGSAIGAIMDGAWTPAQAGALLAAIAAKGESAEEIVGAARAMRERSLHVEHELPCVVDVCGTGGDGARTINISTCVAFIVAGCGVPVAKHGNRAASSLSGGADVLEALGVAIDLPPVAARRALERGGVAFLFAPRYHPAMRAVAPIRRELGIRTLFNVLGPLTNPARATHQVIGVARDAHLELVGEALCALGGAAGAVVHATNGIDEIAGDAPTRIFQFAGDEVRRFTLDPADYGVHASLAAIRGGDARENGTALLAILDGERSPRADVVSLNAALALVVAGRAGEMREGLELARSAVARGDAKSAFLSLRSTEAQFA